MKNSKVSTILLLLLSYCSISYSQSLTTGISSGINFSDIHGQDAGGKWCSKPGASEALSVGYSFNKSIGIQTGIGFSTVSYEHRTQYYQYPMIDYYLNSRYSDMLIAPFYYLGSSYMDFSFVRIPLLLTVSVPSALQFNMRAGLLFSFAKGHGSNPNYYYYYNSYYSDYKDFKKNDFGFLFSSGVSYPLNERIDLSLNFNYITGRKKFMEFSAMRHGSSEITMGVNYNFIKKEKLNNNSHSQSDSSSNRVSVTYSAGLNYSWSTFDVGSKKYSSLIGPSLGFSVNIPLGHEVYFKTGVTFERKGYALKDSSESFYRYQERGSQEYWVDTKINTDYAVVPFIISLPLGKFPGVFFNTGPWLGFKLNSKTVGLAYNEITSGSVYRYTKNIVYDDIEKVISDYDIGWLFSGGVSFLAFNDCKVDLSAQFNAGFRDLFNSKVLNDIDPSSNEQKMKLRTMSVHLGITLPSGKR
jgi:opacity protein-like surface antigen